jgi:hypothetical protein
LIWIKGEGGTGCAPVRGYRSRTHLGGELCRPAFPDNAAVFKHLDAVGVRYRPAVDVPAIDA